MSSFRPGGRIGDELVEIEGRVETQTKKAMLIEFTNGPKEWIPKSQIHGQFESGQEPDVFIFHISEWIAKKAKLI